MRNVLKQSELSPKTAISSWRWSPVRDSSPDPACVGVSGRAAGRADHMPRCCSAKAELEKSRRRTIIATARDRAAPRAGQLRGDPRELSSRSLRAEKGSFTGATEKQVGSSAGGRGPLFLDKSGLSQIPGQGLRFLQERGRAPRIGEDDSRCAGDCRQQQNLEEAIDRGEFGGSVFR